MTRPVRPSTAGSVIGSTRTPSRRGLVRTALRDARLTGNARLHSVARVVNTQQTAPSGIYQAFLLITELTLMPLPTFNIVTVDVLTHAVDLHKTASR